MLRVRFIRNHRLSPTPPGSRASSSRAFMRACSSRSLALRSTGSLPRARASASTCGAIGGNPEAARRLGIPVFGYILTVMFVAGGIAGLAGMAEVTAIQGRLVSELSPGYGFVGFLVSWLARTTAGGILAMAFLFAVISSVGDILQITQGLPFAVVNILMAVILFIVLGRQPARSTGR
jgi:ABC-type uncharacterized transport system permease subunit